MDRSTSPGNRNLFGASPVVSSEWVGEGGLVIMRFVAAFLAGILLAVFLGFQLMNAAPVAVAPPTPPVEQAKPEPAPPEPAPAVWDKAAVLEAAVQKSMADFPGRYSVVVHELPSGKAWSLNADARYHPASTIKMPVVLYALEQHRAGKLGWQDLITYTEADYESPGGGAFEQAPFGGRYPVENLVNRAIKYSNNVAVNMLGRHLGWNNIRAWTRTMNGELYRLSDGMPEVTPMSELGWWLHLNRVAHEDPTRAELVLRPLREVEYDGRIAAGAPAGVKYLHKFGSFDGNYHDAGIIYAERPFVLVVMTDGATVDEADAAIAAVTAAICKVMD